MLLKHGLAGLTHKAAGGADVAIAFTEGYESSADSTVWTITGAALGTASAGREIYVCVTTGWNNRNLTSMTVAGVTTSEVVSQTFNGNARQSIQKAAVPTGTTGDIVITMSGTESWIGASVYAVTGANSEITNTFSASASPADISLDINTTSGGGVIGSVLAGGSTTAWAWSGLTEDHDVGVNVSQRFGTASADIVTGETPRTITATPTGTPSDLWGVAVSISK